MATVPAGRALIVSQLSVVTRGSPSFDASHGIVMFRNTTCSGAASFIDFPTHVGESSHDFRPGAPARGGVSIFAFGSGLDVEAEVRGYTVPVAAVP